MPMTHIKITNFSSIVPHAPLGTKSFALTAKCSTEFILNGVEMRLEVSTPFEWDGASIPRIFWSVIGYYPAGIMLAPSLWHDLIYKNKGWVRNELTGELIFISRKDCDLLFLQHMLICGVPLKDAQTMYKTIRKFGWTYWFDNSILRRFRQ
jgi:hypothetical protein